MFQDKGTMYYIHVALPLVQSGLQPHCEKFNMLSRVVGAILDHLGNQLISESYPPII